MIEFSKTKDELLQHIKEINTNFYGKMLYPILILGILAIVYFILGLLYNARLIVVGCVLIAVMSGVFLLYVFLCKNNKKKIVRMFEQESKDKKADYLFVREGNRYEIVNKTIQKNFCFNTMDIMSVTFARSSIIIFLHSKQFICFPRLKDIELMF